MPKEKSDSVRLTSVAQNQFLSFSSRILYPDITPFRDKGLGTARRMRMKFSGV